MKVLVLASAEQELIDAASYYLQKASPRIAQAFIDEFRHAQTLLAEFSEIGTPVLGNQRVIQFRRFPYSLVYHVAPDCITIRAIAHHRRKPRYRKA